MSNLYIIAGCNGAGKTTASYTMLPTILECKEYINADEIAKGLSPFQPETVAIQAGRLMLSRMQELLQKNIDFAFETTLSTKSFIHLIKKAQAEGYFVTLIYFWLNSTDLAIERVKSRVESGGHHIPADVITRRYASGIRNLKQLYIPLTDYWLIIDNSEPPPVVIAEGYKSRESKVYNKETFNIIEKL
ncbi:MAG: zeta toxin family protein [Candidatus Kapabacteria bacterium]|nr:zeta toxin family protein [Candidatus Kapabacteria bacterium]